MSSPDEPSTLAGPVAGHQRIELLDALRGVALLGILLANIHYFSGWIFLDEAGRAAMAGAAVAEAEHFLYLLLIDGKFYTIFSFLFGIGFALQLQRLQKRSARALTLYWRRLLGLMLIGLVHLCLIWDGDILTLYALTGMVLLGLRGAGDRSLIIGSGLLILSPIVGWPLLRLLDIDPSFGMKPLANAAWATLTHASELPPIEWLSRSDWGSLWSWLQSGPIYRVAYLLESWRLPKVLGVMMLGLWFGRRLAQGLPQDRALLGRVAGWGAAIGLPANAVYAWLGGLQQEAMIPGVAAQAAYALGVVPLGLAYAAALALAWQASGALMWPFVAAGRMALTNYIAQSLICIVVFYGVGFGLIGKLTPPGFYLTALGILVVQAALSALWLRHFRQGPLEALWRRATYGPGLSRSLAG